MKLLLTLALTLLAVQTHAEAVASPDDQSFIDQIQNGKVDAGVRELLARQMQADINAMYDLQEGFDRLGNGPWISRLGQETFVAERKMNRTTGLMMNGEEFDIDAAQQAQREVAKARALAQQAFDKLQ